MRVKLSLLIAAGIVAAMTVIISCQQAAYYGQDITPELYPDNSAIILSRSRVHECEFVAELLKTYQYEVVEYTTIEDCTRIKILTESGLEKFGNMTSPVFRKENSKYEVEARVVSPNGNVSEVGENDITRLDIGKHYEQYRIAFPGLKVGSVIELKEKIKSQYGDMAGRWDFAHEVPSLKSELVFKVPSGSKVRFNYNPPREDEGEIVPTVDGKYDVYSFVMENIPPYKNEKLMSADHTGNPTLRYYTYHIPNESIERVLGIEEGSFQSQPLYITWHNIAKIYGSYYDHLRWESDEEAEDYRKGKEAFVAEFKSKSFDDTEEMLRSFVLDFRKSFQPIEGGYFLRSTNPEEAFITNEGNRFELAYVMREALRDLGIAASVVLVRDLGTGLLDRKMPDIQAFTGAILNIEHGGNEYWIDPGTHACRFDQVPWQCRGVDGLWLLPNGEFVFKKVSMMDSDYNRFVNNEEVVLAADGSLEGSATITIAGQNLIRLRKSIDVDEESRFTEELVELFKERYPDVFDEKSLAIIEESDDSLVVTYRYIISDFADVAGDFMNIDFSRWIGRSYLDVFVEEERLFDVHFPFLHCDRVCVRMKLPAGMKVVEFPKNASRENDCFQYTRAINVDGDAVTFRRCLVLKNSTITAADYAEMKEFIGETYKLDRETMVLKEASM
jgi:hypothetical protein